MPRKPKENQSALVAWASCLAPENVSSRALESALAQVIERLRLPEGLIEKMTGVVSRRVYPSGWPIAQAAAQACEIIFSQGFERSLIDSLFSASVGRDFLEPSTASVIQANLGLGAHCKSLDVSSACLGFIDSLELASLKIAAKKSEYSLVAAGENSRLLLENTLSNLSEPQITVKDFFKNFASLTLGSGAAAMLVGPASRHPKAPRIVGSVSQSDPQSNHLCQGDFSGMQTEAPALLEAGVKLALLAFRKGATLFGWGPDYFDLIICHQVSRVNTERLCQALGLDWKKIVKIYPNFGNMGAAAVPFAFDLASQRSLFGAGHKICLMGIGSGLCCSMMEIEIPS
ncbi:MAG: 3-oxoacyl-ACP synthase III [Deltaproteobacteria bacterium]|jgi:3-oxoacyl-[acyl-carrier-protein] synthase-3|nr:3-oxoacyl-ACP synthase III [Deltaproteobacteria bacterium]